MNNSWYAVYTKPQCEKKVIAQLLKKRIECFAPVNNRYVGAGIKKKLVTEQLFPCFVFVNISEADFLTVKQTGDVLNFVYWLGRPAVIKAAEIENIYHFSKKYSNITLSKIPVNVNGIVRITNTPKLDINAEVITTNTSTIKVSLPSLGYMLQADASQGIVQASISDISKHNVVIN